MNSIQRKILISVAVIIAMMMLFPPFATHLPNGVQSSNGYSFILAPPSSGWSIKPVLNSTQLLIQWLGVAGLGAIAFVLAKDYKPRGATKTDRIDSSRQAASTQQSNREPLTSMQLYEAFVGEQRHDRYLEIFQRFDARPTKMRVGWNWAAFFFTGFWALHRKMYGWFFVLWAVVAISGALDKASPGGGFFVSLIPWIAFSIYADALYYRRAKRKIAKASRIDDPSRVLEYLRKKGGVHKSVLWVCLSILAIGVIAPVLIPALATKKDDSAKVGHSVPDVNAPIQPTGQFVFDDERDEFGGIILRDPENKPAQPNSFNDLIPSKR
ncbi:MAG: DUF2628 domain-containing protein [Polaromonas sp.]